MKNCNDVFHKNCLTEKEKFLRTNFFFACTYIHKQSTMKTFEF